ncbi:hypothetical protein [Enterobacter hormaechei]|uniref:hypothetical protein n=1 Tax=Enterobacter hormaechei TaxID=158836 RepID=UPI0034D27444
MSLRSQRTQWVMFLPCTKPTDLLRHVMDLVYGVYCLEQAGVDPQHIHIYIDSCGQNTDSSFSEASVYPYQSKPTAEFFSDLNQNTYENLVMFVTGHGGLFGLDADPPISPSRIITALKATPNLQTAVLYLGQCFAGTFNFVNAGKGEGENLEIILAGATNLQESLSLSTSQQFLNQRLPWLANVFLLNVFNWFLEPKDIDGDGKVTIMDSYKFAGILTNLINKQGKNGGFVMIMDMLQDYRDARDLAGIDTGDPQVNMANKVNSEAKYRQCIQQLGLHHIHQECWILNSRPAQKLEF